MLRVYLVVACVTELTDCHVIVRRFQRELTKHREDMIVIGALPQKPDSN